MVQDLAALTGIRIELRDFFGHPTPAALAAHFATLGVRYEKASR
jgi:hypothetical protein